MEKRESFYDVLTAAVNDVALHGYDSAERIEFWTKALRRAAEATMKTPAEMQQMLKDALQVVFNRMVEHGGALKVAPGIPRYTIERIRPALRGELDRRILASAALIKSNREEAVEKSLRRFQGWATSIPKGGSADPDKQQAKSDIRKSIAALPFAERRVLIDQGHKLTASIRATIAEGNGAIAMVWKSRWRQPGYDYREDHKERDGVIYTIRGNWAQERGLMKPGPDGYYDQITQVAEEPFCRCSAQYIFNLRQLPADMLTVKGRDELERVKVN